VAFFSICTCPLSLRRVVESSLCICFLACRFAGIRPPRPSRKPTSEILSHLGLPIGLPALDLRKVSIRIAHSTLPSSSSNTTLVSLSFSASLLSDVETELLLHVSPSIRRPTIPVPRQTTVVPPSSAWWVSIALPSQFLRSPIGIRGLRLPGFPGCAMEGVRCRRRMECAVFLFANGVAMEDGRRANNGSEELMMRPNISFPPSPT